MNGNSGYSSPDPSGSSISTVHLLRNRHLSNTRGATKRLKIDQLGLLRKPGTGLTPTLTFLFLLVQLVEIVPLCMTVQWHPPRRAP